MDCAAPDSEREQDLGDSGLRGHAGIYPRPRTQRGNTAWPCRFSGQGFWGFRPGYMVHRGSRHLVMFWLLVTAGAGLSNPMSNRRGFRSPGPARKLGCQEDENSPDRTDSDDEPSRLVVVAAR